MTIVEQSDGIYRVVVRAPPTVEAINAPTVIWPDACEVRENAPLRFAAGRISLIVCQGGLGGRSLRVDYPVYNPSITTLFRLQTATDLAVSAALPPDALVWSVPTEPSLATIARDYTELGFRHIWEGIDHLLFVAGLLLLARVPRRILLAVTGFTAAHSITLSIAALGYVHVPVAPVEALIALSIVLLAAEIVRGDATALSHRYPIALAFVFGLLHGFGFASALGEIGLPRNELASGLLFFNIGVELGQLAFIALVAMLVVFLRLAKRRVTVPNSGWPAQLTLERVTVPAAYLLGVPSSYWFVERVTTAFIG